MRDTVFRFAGFELDEQRGELRGQDGTPIRLRPKAFEMLGLFAANPGRVLAKEELMEAVWPKVHVGEDSLFQCIREIRSALGDERRELIRLVSGRGYLFAAEVTGAAPVDTATPEPAPRLRLTRAHWALVATAGVGVIAAIMLALVVLLPDLAFRRAPPTLAVMPVIDASGLPQGATLATAVTELLIDGFARIDGIRVVAPAEASASSPAAADLVVRGELKQGQRSWTLQARIVKASTAEVQSVATASVDSGEPDMQLQQSRLAASVGDQLARKLNAVLEPGTAATPSGGDATAGGTRVVIEQAMASINQTSRERFGTAQTMLENALAAEPDNVDLQVALAGLQLRGIQMVWYGADESAAAEDSARSLLERAIKARPRSIPVLEAHCRFLSATNSFVESLVACAKALSLDPWDGQALYLVGLGQVNLGRFEDALATFEQADRFDTPEVSRWTWLLGAGWVNLLLDRNAEAVPWLQRSIAVTPGSGRSYLLLAAAYLRLGRADDAKAALTRALELRPGSTAANVSPPTRNVSPIFLKASERLIGDMIETGLPDQ